MAEAAKQAKNYILQYKEDGQAHDTLLYPEDIAAIRVLVDYAERSLYR